eukprot:13075250-Alexandrium_andersonii.AAC.1
MPAWNVSTTGWFMQFCHAGTGHRRRHKVCQAGSTIQLQVLFCRTQSLNTHLSGCQCEVMNGVCGGTFSAELAAT